MVNIIQILVAIVTVIIALSSLPLLFRLQQPTSPVWWAIKVFASALSPILVLTSALCLACGLIFASPLILVMASYSALIFVIHIIKVTHGPNPSTGFGQAFGLPWEDQLPKKLRSHFLKNRGSRLPRVPDPVFRQNVSFHTIAGTTRQLLCDIWEPATAIDRSGLAFIYLHGSAWSVLDKDYGTRTFFRHLTSQGHMIMDVAYRLYPETNMLGIIHDAKHAIAWLKANASLYRVNPERIVIGGGSAGGHIALLTAYTNGNKEFTPDDLEGVDTRVRGVINLYGPPDLEALYYHTGQHITKNRPTANKPEKGMSKWVQKSMGKLYHDLGMDRDTMPGDLATMFGGPPKELPEPYRRFSPVTHVKSRCPYTLLIQGEDDLITPVNALQVLYYRLKEAGVPTVMHVLPQTDHAFDLALPKLSPSAHNAYYDIERFLGLMCVVNPTYHVPVIKNVPFRRTGLSGKQVPAEVSM